MSILHYIDAKEREYVTRIAALEAEVKEWRKKYFVAVDGSLRHTGAMTAMVLRAALDGAVVTRPVIDGAGKTEGTDDRNGSDEQTPDHDGRNEV